MRRNIEGYSWTEQGQTSVPDFFPIIPDRESGDYKRIQRVTYSVAIRHPVYRISRQLPQHMVFQGRGAGAEENQKYPQEYRGDACRLPASSVQYRQDHPGVQSQHRIPPPDTPGVPENQLILFRYLYTDNV